MKCVRAFGLLCFVCFVKFVFVCRCFKKFGFNCSWNSNTYFSNSFSSVFYISLVTRPLAFYIFSPCLIFFLIVCFLVCLMLSVCLFINMSVV